MDFDTFIKALQKELRENVKLHSKLGEIDWMTSSVLLNIIGKILEDGE